MAVAEEFLARIAEEKLKLLSKQDYEVLKARFSSEEDIIEWLVGAVTTAGGLQEAGVGSILEPPFLCEWIVEPLRNIFCSPPEGKPYNVKLEKAIYGKTRYGWSFYDPGYDVFHIIKTLQYALVRPEISKNIGKILVGSGVSETASLQIVFQHYILSRLVAVVYSRKKTPFMRRDDLYNYLEKEVWNGIELFVIRDPRLGVIGFRKLDDLILGFMLSYTPLGYGFLLPRDTEVLSDYFYTWLAERVAKVLARFKPAYAATKASKKTVIAYGEKLTYEAERYGENRAIVKLLRLRVWNMLDKYSLDNFTRQAYVSAALELAFSWRPPKGMSEQVVRRYTWDLEWEDLLRHWLAKWSALGLKREILLEVAEEVKRIWQYMREKHLLLRRILHR